MYTLDMNTEKELTALRNEQEWLAEEERASSVCHTCMNMSL